jgi:hypothetical protein
MQYATETLSKDEMIEQILYCNLESCQTDVSYNDDFIHHLLLNGYKGLKNMTLSELEAELKHCAFTENE